MALRSPLSGEKCNPCLPERSVTYVSGRSQLYCANSGGGGAMETQMWYAQEPVGRAEHSSEAFCSAGGAGNVHKKVFNELFGIGGIVRRRIGRASQYQSGRFPGNSRL